MNASDRLVQLLVIRQLLLQRLIAGEERKLNRLFDGIAQTLQRAILGARDLTGYQQRQLDKQIAALVKLARIPAPALTELPALEATYMQAALQGVGITDAALPARSTLQAIADSALVQGATIKDWFSRLSNTLRFDIERAVKVGVSLGQTNRQIADSIIGMGDKGPQPIAKARRDANAITRTAVQTIANDARLAFYGENPDYIKAVQWVSTLDSRTSDICIARSGKTWSFPDFEPQGHKIPWNGGPPAHWACRSTVIPILKTLREMGIDRDNFQQTTRASMDGQVAADITFDDFLKGKPKEFADQMLGKGRAELWREGKITLSELLNAKGQPLTLTQLAEKYGKPEID